MRTQVAIIGAGPAGLLLSHMLDQQGIDSVVLERQTRDYVLGRIRAGVLESTSVDVLREAGLAARLDREGLVHDGVRIAWNAEHSFFCDCNAVAGKPFVTYGQTLVQQDLYAAADARGQQILHEVADIRIHDIESSHPWLEFQHEGRTQRLDCDYIAGCDGFHGVARQAIPLSVRREFEKVYPFGWLGVLSHVKPLHDLVYAFHPDGFALASKRNENLGRFYVQVPLDTRVEDWSDERFWAAFKARFPADIAAQVQTGASIEKSIAPLRSFVAEPMRHGSLFLAGDAAHIVPPTGAKGLNLAVSDVYYLARALSARYRERSELLIDSYSATALRRVWSSVQTSWYLTHLLHPFPSAGDFERKAQIHELRFLQSSRHAQDALAERFAGDPLETA